MIRLFRWLSAGLSLSRSHHCIQSLSLCLYTHRGNHSTQRYDFDSDCPALCHRVDTIFYCCMKHWTIKLTIFFSLSLNQMLQNQRMFLMWLTILILEMSSREVTKYVGNIQKSKRMTGNFLGKVISPPVEWLLVGSANKIASFGENALRCAFASPCLLYLIGMTSNKSLGFSFLWHVGYLAYFWL